MKISYQSPVLAATKIQQQGKNKKIKLTSLLMAESESVANLQSSSLSSLMAAVFVSFRFGSSMHVESVDSRARYLIGQSILPLLFNQSNRRTQVWHQLPLIITSDSFFSCCGIIIIKISVAVQLNTFDLVESKIRSCTSGEIEGKTLYGLHKYL